MTSSPASAPVEKPGFVEFVCLVAALMAMNALAIDSMLPALPHIGQALAVEDPNGVQWVVTAYLLGFGAAQLVYGPLADRYGRKPILMIGVGVYVLFSLLATFAPTFDTLIAARVGQGLGSAATRVLVVSIVRDRYSGREMARVMSLSFLVFLGVLMAFGLSVMLWAALRLPETLHPEYRQPIRMGRILSGFREALTNRVSLGYTLAMGALMGGLFGFINSAEQIFSQVFHAPDVFPLVFAAIAGGIAVASLLNARLVGKLGSRLISHTALIGFILIGAIHAAVAMAGFENIWTFAVLQALTMFCFGLMAGNFGSMAMEPMGHIAGTASSAQGFLSTIMGSLAGFAVGQQFNGSTVPMMVGITCYGLLALAVVLFAEKGRLFKSQHLPPVKPA